jgi:hypothetical protein
LTDSRRGRSIPSFSPALFQNLSTIFRRIQNDAKPRLQLHLTSGSLTVDPICLRYDAGISKIRLRTIDKQSTQSSFKEGAIARARHWQSQATTENLPGTRAVGDFTRL